MTFGIWFLTHATHIATADQSCVATGSIIDSAGLEHSLGASHRPTFWLLYLCVLYNSI